MEHVHEGRVPLPFKVGAINNPVIAINGTQLSVVVAAQLLMF